MQICIIQRTCTHQNMVGEQAITGPVDIHRFNIIIVKFTETNGTVIIITSKSKNINVDDSLLYPGLIQLVPFVKKLDNAIHWINLCPLDGATRFPDSVLIHWIVIIQWIVLSNIWTTWAWSTGIMLKDISNKYFNMSNITWFRTTSGYWRGRWRKWHIFTSPCQIKKVVISRNQWLKQSQKKRGNCEQSIGSFADKNQ